MSFLSRALPEVRLMHTFNSPIPGVTEVIHDMKLKDGRQRCLADFPSSTKAIVSADDSLVNLTFNFSLAYQREAISDQAHRRETMAYYVRSRSGISAGHVELGLLLVTLLGVVLGRPAEGAAIALVIAWIAEYWIHIFLFLIFCWIFHLEFLKNATPAQASSY